MRMSHESSSTTMRIFPPTLSQILFLPSFLARLASGLFSEKIVNFTQLKASSSCPLVEVIILIGLKDQNDVVSAEQCLLKHHYHPQVLLLIIIKLMVMEIQKPHFMRRAKEKRHRFIACSSPLPPPPPPSSSRSSFNSGPILSKRIELDVSDSKRKKLSGTATKEVSSSPYSQIQTRKREYLVFKSFFGKRSLWRRILFASKKLRSIILLNVITVVYASNIPVVKEVEAIMSPAAFTVVRFTLSAIPFIPFVLKARGDAHTRNAGVELGFWVSLGYLMQAFGLLTSDAGRASFLSMFTVIVVPLLDGLLGAAIPARIWFGAIVSIVGVGMLESSGSPPSVGDFLNFLSAVFFGVHMLRTEHISRSIRKEKFLPLLGYEMAAMRDVSATETAIIYGLEPLWGAGFAWFLLGERWGASGWIGAALVLGREGKQRKNIDDMNMIMDRVRWRMDIPRTNNKACDTTSGLGGSLTVQICGSASESNLERKQSKKGDNTLVSDKNNGFSASPIILSSRKDGSDILK
ncbi:EamA domain containing protein [Senna tora]|uniref:EamA domain containing protein n=1 Tax=Senna tora TaxID=362788 RepID=A0A834TUB3_9FABA|nr:EamA domain containing protein [Senna tora]